MADVMSLFKSPNMATEDDAVARPLATSREPKRKQKNGEPGSLGDQAFIDACVIVAIAWLILIFFAYSLRNHNV